PTEKERQHMTTASTRRKERTGVEGRRLRRRRTPKQVSAGKVESESRPARFVEKIPTPATTPPFQTSPGRSSQRPNHNQPAASTGSVPGRDNATTIRDCISRIVARYRTRTATSRRS